MKSTLRGSVVALSAAALVITMAGVGGAATNPKQQSSAQYVKTVCSTYESLDKQLVAYAKAVQNLDETSVPAFQTSAASLTNPVLGQFKAAGTKLKAAYPNVSNGKKIGTLLATHVTDIYTKLSAALTVLQNTPGPAGPPVFLAAIGATLATLSDPFSKVTDQGLITAFQKEKLCKSVVTVTGG